MRYFRVTDNMDYESIWMTDDNKTKERLLWSTEQSADKIKILKKYWTAYHEPCQDEKEEEITEEEAFARML